MLVTAATTKIVVTNIKETATLFLIQISLLFFEPWNVKSIFDFEHQERDIKL